MNDNFSNESFSTLNSEGDNNSGDLDDIRQGVKTVFYPRELTQWGQTRKRFSNSMKRLLGC